MNIYNILCFEYLFNNKIELVFKMEIELLTAQKVSIDRDHSAIKVPLETTTVISQSGRYVCILRCNEFQILDLDTLKSYLCHEDETITKVMFSTDEQSICWCCGTYPMIIRWTVFKTGRVICCKYSLRNLYSILELGSHLLYIEVSYEEFHEQPRKFHLISPSGESLDTSNLEDFISENVNCGFSEHLQYIYTGRKLYRLVYEQHRVTVEYVSVFPPPTYEQHQFIFQYDGKVFSRLVDVMGRQRLMLGANIVFEHNKFFETTRFGNLLICGNDTVINLDTLAVRTISMKSDGKVMVISKSRLRNLASNLLQKSPLYNQLHEHLRYLVNEIFT